MPARNVAVVPSARRLSRICGLLRPVTMRPHGSRLKVPVPSVVLPSRNTRALFDTPVTRKVLLTPARPGSGWPRTGGGVTDTAITCEEVFDPPGPLTVRLAVKSPGVVYT